MPVVRTYTSAQLLADALGVQVVPNLDEKQLEEGYNYLSDYVVCYGRLFTLIKDIRSQIPELTIVAKGLYYMVISPT